MLKTILFCFALLTKSYAARELTVSFGHYSNGVVNGCNVRFSCFIFNPGNVIDDQHLTITGYVVPKPDDLEVKDSYTFTYPKTIKKHQSFYFEYTNASGPGNYKNFFTSGAQNTSFHPMAAMKLSIQEDVGELVGHCETYCSSTGTVGLTNEYSYPINGGKPF